MLPWAHLKPLSGGDDQRQPIFVRGGSSLLINMCCPFPSHFQYSVQQQDLYVWRTRLTRHKCLLHMLCLHSHSIKYDCIFPHALLKQLLWHAKSVLHDSHMQTTDLPVVIIIETQKLKTERHHYGILFFSNGKELFFNVRLLFFFLFPPLLFGKESLVALWGFKEFLHEHPTVQHSPCSWQVASAVLWNFMPLFNLPTAQFVNFSFPPSLSIPKCL